MISAIRATLSIYARETWFFITHAKFMDIKTFSLARIVKVGVQRRKKPMVGYITLNKMHHFV